MGEQYPIGTCFHEAGHAIVAAALGLEVLNIHINKDDESGATDLSDGPLSLIDQVAVCFAGLEAQLIWEHPSEHLAEAGDYATFRGWELVKYLSDEERDALERAGYERANELLLANKALVEIVAQRLAQQGFLTAPEFKHLKATLAPGPF
jgi:hypothetical protein